MKNKIALQLSEKIGNFAPEKAIILGSGLSEVANLIKPETIINYSNIENMPQSTVSGHLGKFIFGYIENTKIVCMQGRIHLYEGYSAYQIFEIIEALSEIGVKELILTNAAGSLDTNMPPASIMLISDHINFSGKNPLTGLSNAFVDLSDLYNEEARTKIKQIAKANGLKLFEGTYILAEGPNFETAAEIKMFQTLGANAVGMSTVPEALSAAYLGIKVIGLSIISNFGTKMSDKTNSHEQTLHEAAVAAKNAAIIIQQYCKGGL